MTIVGILSQESTVNGVRPRSRRRFSLRREYPVRSEVLQGFVDREYPRITGVECTGGRVNTIAFFVIVRETIATCGSQNFSIIAARNPVLH